LINLGGGTIPSMKKCKNEMKNEEDDLIKDEPEVQPHVKDEVKKEKVSLDEIMSKPTDVKQEVVAAAPMSLKERMAALRLKQENQQA